MRAATSRRIGIAIAEADVIADEQLQLRAAIECRTLLRQQLGSAAFTELLDIVTFLDDAPRVNSIWADTLYPNVLAIIEREAPSLRPAIARVRHVLDERGFTGVRLTAEEQRITAGQFDTHEERRGER